MGHCILQIKVFTYFSPQIQHASPPKRNPVRHWMELQSTNRRVSTQQTGTLLETASSLSPPSTRLLAQVGFIIPYIHRVNIGP